MLAQGVRGRVRPAEVRADEAVDVLGEGLRSGFAREEAGRQVLDVSLHLEARCLLQRQLNSLDRDALQGLTRDVVVVEHAEAKSLHIVGADQHVQHPEWPVPFAVHDDTHLTSWLPRV
eukprot:5025382-Prymnesium_polylepis.2